MTPKPPSPPKSRKREPRTPAASKYRSHGGPQGTFAAHAFDGSLAGILRMLPGGRKTFVALLRSSNDPAAVEFIRQWDALPEATKKKVDLMRMAGDAQTDWQHLAACATESAIRTGSNAAAMIAAVEQPAVVRSLARTAKTASSEGDGARRMLLQHTGFLPTPKSATINILNQLGRSVEGQVGDGDGDPSALIPFATQIMNADRLLEAPKDDA